MVLVVLKQFEQCLFEANDVADLAERIQYVRSLSLVEREELAKAMRNYVTKELSIEKVMGNHETLYKNLILIKCISFLEFISSLRLTETS